MAISNDIVSAVLRRQCVLFSGAGLTAASGGATWNDLVRQLSGELGYSSVLTDPFEIMTDMCRVLGRERVYSAVQKRLEGVELRDPIRQLASLPWFAAFTTNYDQALENAMNELQQLTVTVVRTGNEFELSSLQSEVLCVKLMGSVDVPDGSLGSMILDKGDLELAREERSRILDQLAIHAANLAFVFVGYSFNDEIFTGTIDKLSKLIGEPKNTYFAVFREQPDEERTYWLTSHGVRIIVADLEEFSAALEKEVSLRNPEDLRTKRIPSGSDVLAIDATRSGNFLSQYDPVFIENLELPVNSLDFFKGNTDSLQPFGIGWHFARNETDAIVDLIVSDQEDSPKVYRVEGPPGSGRTFVILAAISRLVRDHRSVGVKIPRSSINQMPSQLEHKGFVDEIKRVADDRQIAGPDRIVFWAEHSLEESTLMRFEKLCDVSECPVFLIYEDAPTINPESDADTLSPCVSVDAELSEEDRARLEDYLLFTVRRHKFAEISVEEVKKIIEGEKKFLPIMYQTIDPARRTIDEIIEDEFSKIGDEDARTMIAICTLCSTVGLSIPVSLLKRSVGKSTNRLWTYEDVFSVSDRARVFIKQTVDRRTNHLFSIWHECIAEHISGVLGHSANDRFVELIAETVDLRSRIEAEFARSLFIKNGVNAEVVRPFSKKGLEASLVQLKKRQPARPILHHLARFYMRENVKLDEVIPLLESALAEPIERYALYEKKENVMTTLASARWEQGRLELVHKDREDPDVREIISLLVRARKTRGTNTHAYFVHARILRELWQDKDLPTRLILSSEAVDVLNQGMEHNVGDILGMQRLSEALIECLAEIDYDEALAAAERMLMEEKNGTGFYTMARIEYHRMNNKTKASVHLDKALSGEKYPTAALALKLDILIEDKFPDTKLLLSIAERLYSMTTEKEPWRSLYHMAAVFAMHGMYDLAVALFRRAYQRAPLSYKTHVGVFWNENGQRKTHYGKIGNLTSREGWIYSHTLIGWGDELYFYPPKQTDLVNLKTGRYVEFEIGFSPRGPVAFDVRLSRTSTN